LGSASAFEIFSAFFASIRPALRRKCNNLFIEILQ
jgi:hypothetical protein